MLTDAELKSIRDRSDAVLCSHLLHLCERGVVRSLKDVPRLLADLEALREERDSLAVRLRTEDFKSEHDGYEMECLTDELDEVKDEAERHKNNWLGVCEELKDLKACLHTYELMEEKHNAALERVRAALTEESVYAWWDHEYEEREDGSLARLRRYSAHLRSLLEEKP